MNDDQSKLIERDLTTFGLPFADRLPGSHSVCAWSGWLLLLLFSKLEKIRCVYSHSLCLCHNCELWNTLRHNLGSARKSTKHLKITASSAFPSSSRFSPRQTPSHVERRKSGGKGERGKCKEFFREQNPTQARLPKV